MPLLVIDCDQTVFYDLYNINNEKLKIKLITNKKVNCRLIFQTHMNKLKLYFIKIILQYY